MAEPIILSPQNIPNPDRPGEFLTPVPPPDGKTSIIVILALALGAYGIYRMVKEDEALDSELEDDDDFEDEDDDGGPPDTGPFSAPDTGPFGR